MSTQDAVARAQRRLKLAIALAAAAVVLGVLALGLSDWLWLPAVALGVIATFVLYFGVILRATFRGSDPDVGNAVLELVRGPLSGRMLTRSREQTSISLVDRATVPGYLMTVRWREEEGGVCITVESGTPRAFLNWNEWNAWVADWQSVVEGLVRRGYVHELQRPTSRF